MIILILYILLFNIYYLMIHCISINLHYYPLTLHYFPVSINSSHVLGISLWYLFNNSILEYNTVKSILIGYKN